MPYDDPEPDDPHELVGVSLPGDEATTREMARAFADEFAQMGFGRECLLQLFANPFYAGAHAARQLLGDAEISRIVDESVLVYGRGVCAIQDAGGVEGDEEGEDGPSNEGPKEPRSVDGGGEVPETFRGKRALRVLVEPVGARRDTGS